MPDIFQENLNSEFCIKERSGAISIAELLNSAKHVIRDSDNKDNRNGLILDYRKAWLSSDLTEVVRICNQCKKHTNLFPKTNIAVVTSDPRIVASTILIRRNGEHIPIKPFSTIEGAKKWINFFM